MGATRFRRKTVGRADLPAMAGRLIGRLADFSPDLVIYLEQGGKAFGLHVADQLGIPAAGIDVRYPFSRFLDRFPRGARGLLWPVKEIAYRCSSPELGAEVGPIGGAEKVVLVDDSASTGRSLMRALAALERRGLARDRIRVAVIRCGRSARGLVDYFETEKPVLFIGGERQ